MHVGTGTRDRYPGRSMGTLPGRVELGSTGAAFGKGREEQLGGTGKLQVHWSKEEY